MSNIIYSCGIDPGMKGALVLLSKQDAKVEVVSLLAMPVKDKEIDGKTLVQTLKQWNSTYGSFNASIEKQMVLHGQGLVSGFTTGRGMGFLGGIMVALNIPYKVVSCREWQKFFPYIKIPAHIDALNIKDSKKRSLALCEDLFPDLQIKTKRNRYRDEVSDATLISYWTLLS